MKQSNVNHNIYIFKLRIKLTCSARIFIGIQNSSWVPFLHSVRRCRKEEIFPLINNDAEQSRVDLWSVGILIGLS